MNFSPILLLLGAIGALAAAPGPGEKTTFLFRDTAYWYRWSGNDQHEFTPKGQEDLQKWTDMVTINLYADASDGDALAIKANTVLENYKSHHGIVLKTNSVPRTPTRPAEHYIAVVLGQPAFLEAAFARFRLADGSGCAIIYSHRIYGEKAGDKMSAWLEANGPAIEKALMSIKTIPVPLPASRKASNPAPTRG